MFLGFNSRLFALDEVATRESPFTFPWAGTGCNRAALLGTRPGVSPHSISLPWSGCCISHSGQGWLASDWARGRFHLTGTWCGRGWESRAEPETGGSRPLKAGRKYFAKAGQVRQVASHCLPKTLPTCPEGAQDEAREQRGRGKLRQGSVANPTVRGVSMPNRPRKGSCTCPREAPAILGKHSPGRQKPHLLLLLLSQTSKKG